MLSRASSDRTARARSYLMCPPTYFDVVYAINPWMDPEVGVDGARARRQWAHLVDTYRRLGHRVDLLDPVAGLPDLVFAANGATSVAGQVLLARFATTQRHAEAEVHARWYDENAERAGQRRVQRPVATNEAEGDFAVLDDRILAGHGFRTTLAAHSELATLTGLDVLSLELVDERFYHLDVALCVLDDRTDQVAYVPEAFSPATREILARLFPDAIIVEVAEALRFGLNAVSDGHHVVLQQGSPRFVADLRAAGYEPVEVDLSELIKGGGAVKCCTQELRGVPAAPIDRPHDTVVLTEGR